MRFDQDIVIPLDFEISLFTLIIWFLLIFGGIKGWMRGSVVHSLSLSALVAGLVICILFTKIVYKYLVANESSIPDLFSVIFLGFIFVAAIYGSHYVANVVERNFEGITAGRINKGIGIFFGITKYLIIAAVYLVMLYKIDEYGKFMPPREMRSKWARFCTSTITTAFPTLRFEASKNKTKKIEEDKDDDSLTKKKKKQNLS